MKTLFKNIGAAVLTFIVILTASTASSQEENSWEFNLAPFYLWAANLEGDATVSHRQIALFESMNEQPTEYNTFFNGQTGFSDYHYKQGGKILK